MLELRVIRLGWCKGLARMARQSLSLRQGLRMARFPALAVVIRHPTHGTTLFDTGYGPAFFAATRALPERIYRWLTPVTQPASETLPARLAAMGLTPDRVMLSHLHADHVAGLFDLPPLPCLASREALAHLRGLSRLSALKAGIPAGLRDGLLSYQINELESLPRAPSLPGFAPGYDLFGDNSAISVALPGHGTGQTGLWLPQTNLGPVLLVADAIWSMAALRDDDPPPLTTLRQLGDARAYLSTFAALRALHVARPEVHILASHCEEAEALADA